MPALLRDYALDVLHHRLLESIYFGSLGDGGVVQRYTAEGFA
jgi:hypothetical protein